MRARRALLYMPGHDLHKIEKAAALDLDCAILDLEDGAAQLRKDEARATIVQALTTLDFGATERLVRVNPYRTGWTDTDLDAVLPAHPDGIVLPKADADGVKRISARMRAAEEANGWPVGGMALIAIAETARAIIHLDELCAADERLQAVICGGEDLAAEMGAVRTREANELFYVRSMVVLYTAAYQLQAIDMVNVDFNDIHFVHQEARRGAEMGFSGKQIIHPRQIEPVQRAFTPTDEEIAQAQSLVAAFHASQAQGMGAFAFEGTMVDKPVVLRAENILARARAAGKITE